MEGTESGLLDMAVARPEIVIMMGEELVLRVAVRYLCLQKEHQLTPCF